MATTEWPNPCEGCHKVLGLVSDTELIVDPRNGEMRHAACATPELVADDDQKEGRWLKRLADMKHSEITAVMNQVRLRSEFLRAKPISIGRDGERLENELKALNEEFEGLRTHQQSLP